MSRRNKVNKDHYSQRGRLTPDEAARERQKQLQAAGRAGRGADVTGQAGREPRAAPASSRRRGESEG